MKTEELEKNRLSLQKRLDSAKTHAARNKLGQFATPSKLASEIVASAISLLPSCSPIRFLEPGFGTGPFYSALLHQAPASRLEVAEGYEVDPHYAEPAEQLWRDTKLSLHLEDFALAKPPGTEATKFNLVVCNPPYVRHHHLSQQQKRDLQTAVAQYLHFEMNGLSGLYTYFLFLSLAWMAQGGVAAWLIPSEFMDVNYGRRLKEFLLKNVTLLRIHRFDPREVQFEDAWVSSAVVFFKNSPPPDGHEAAFTFGGALDQPRTAELIKLTALRHLSKWTSLPYGPSRCACPNNENTLAELFVIKRGLATGCNSFFILTPEQVERLKLPKKFLKPILPGPRELDADEIPVDKNGEPAIAKRRYLLSCNLPESEVEAKYPLLWQYLQHGIEERIHERYLCRHREPWYSQETRLPAPFLCTYMGRPTRRNDLPFRFILNRSQAIAANVYLMLYPKQALAALLREMPELYDIIWNALSSITAEMLVGEGRVYGGGLHKLEPKELANVAAGVVLSVLPRKKELTLLRQLELF